jgi:hypothetical protein
MELIMHKQLNNLKIILIKRGLHGTDICRDLRISLGSWYRWVGGWVKMPDDIQRNVANHLCLTVPELFPEYQD